MKPFFSAECHKVSIKQSFLHFDFVKEQFLQTTSARLSPPLLPRYRNKMRSSFYLFTYNKLSLAFKSFISELSTAEFKVILDILTF